MDHVSILHDHCGSKVQDFLDGLEGDWEAEHTRVEEALLCRYRTLDDAGVEDNRRKIDDLHQRASETFDHYIKLTQKLAKLCKAHDDLYNLLTVQFCRGILDKSNHKSLTVTPGVREQRGKTRFETCMSFATALVPSDITYRERRRSPDSDSESSGTDSELSDWHSDTDTIEVRRGRRRRKKKETKHRKEKKEGEEGGAIPKGRRQLERAGRVRKRDEKAERKMEELKNLTAHTRITLLVH